MYSSTMQMCLLFDHVVYMLLCHITSYSITIYLVYRSSCGVLKTCFGESDLELYHGILPLTVEEWKKDPVLSLREATKKLNSPNEFEVGRCNCKSECQSLRCSCRKLGSPCTSKCHQGLSCSNCPPSQMDTPAKRRKVVSCLSTAKNLILKQRQSQHKSTTQTSTVIDLTSEPDTNESSSTKKKVDKWVKVEDVCLTTADQGIFLHPTAWVTDNILAGYFRGKLVHMVFNLLALGRCVPLISRREISSRLSTMDMPIGLL